MPVIIRSADMKYKDSQGRYIGVNAVAERATADMIADIEEVAAQQRMAIEEAGAGTIEDVEQAVADSQAAVAGIDAQRETMIAAIANVAGQGTDSTFTQPGVAADAAAVGALNAALNDIEEDYYGEQTINLYNPDDPDILQNQAINTSGEIISYPNTFEIGFIPCSIGDTFTFVSNGAYTVTTTRTFVFYDRNKNFLSGNSSIKGPTVTIPVECAYFRTLVKVSESSNLMIVKNDSTIHEYVPYGFNNSFKYDTLERLDSFENRVQEIEDIKELIGVPQELIFEKVNTGHYIDTYGTTIDISSPYKISSSYLGKADFRACSPGDVFVISLRGDNAFRPYAFYDAEGNRLSVSDNIQYHDERVVAPESSAYVAFNSASALDEYGTVFVGEDRFKQIHNEIDSKYETVNGRLTDIESLFEENSPVEIAEGEQSGYYRIYQNAIEHKTNTSFTCSMLEITKSMFSVECIIKSISGISDTTIFYGFADESNNLISKCDVVVGTHQTEIPENAKYLYLSFLGSTFCDGYVIHPNNVATTKDIKALHISNAYEGLTGVAFGTSLTYRAQTTGGYLQYLPALSGITFDNQGVGSSAIMGNGGELDMLAKIKAYTGYTGKSICLLEGFVNDWYGNKPLGTYSDATETSVCGCVRSALNYILSQNANLTVFLILDPYGRNYNSVDCSSTATNRDGLTQYAYYEEIARVAESLGVPVIKEYAGSQISENTPQYLLDNIHPNALGAKQSANFIWSRMKTYFPNAVS